MVEQHSADMVKNMVKQAVSNPAIRSKLAINVRAYARNYTGQKSEGKSGQH